MSKILSNVRAKRLPRPASVQQFRRTTSQSNNALPQSRSSGRLAPVVVPMDDTSTVDSTLGDLDYRTPTYDDTSPPPRRPRHSLLDANILIAPASTAFAKFKRFCRWAYRKLGLKHLLFLALIIFYTIFGAAIFLALEKSHDAEKLAKDYSEYAEKRRVFVRTLAADMITAGRGPTAAVSSTRARALMDARLRDYEQNIEFKVKNETDWNFWHAMYFAGTIYTTIGYGDIYCVTKAGRLFTIFYSLIGIPLVLSVLTDLGQLLLKLLFNMTLLYTNIVGFILPISLCTSATPDDPRMADKKLTKEKNETDDINNKLETVIDMEETVERSSFTDENVGDLAEMERRQEEEDEDEYEYQLMQIPVLTALLATVGWIFFCGALFCIWEDWSYFTSVYFFFISLSTIGLGDETPRRKDIMVCTYALVIVGLALVSMCITVIQRRLEDLYLQLLRMILQEYHKQLSQGGDQMGATIGIMSVWSNNKAAKFLMPLLSKDKKQNVVQKFQDEAKAKGFAMPAVLRDLDPKTGLPAVLKVSKESKSAEGQAQLREAVGVAINRAAEKSKARHEQNEDAILENMYTVQARAPTPPPATPVEPPVPPVPAPPPPPHSYDAEVQTTHADTKDEEEQTPIVLLLDAQTQSLDTALFETPHVDEASQTSSVDHTDAFVQYEEEPRVDAFAQTEAVDTRESWSQFEIVPQAHNFSQTPTIDTIEASAQYEETPRATQTCQTDQADTKDATVQYEEQEKTPEPSPEPSPSPPPPPPTSSDQDVQTESVPMVDAETDAPKSLTKDRVVQAHIYDENHVEIQTEAIQTKNQRLQTPLPEYFEQETQTEALAEPTTPTTSKKWGKAKNNLHDIIKKAMDNMKSSTTLTAGGSSKGSKSGLSTGAPSITTLNQEPTMAAWSDIRTEHPPSSDEEEEEDPEEVRKRMMQQKQQRPKQKSIVDEPEPANWRDQLKKVNRGDSSKRARQDLHWDPIDGLHAERQRRVSDLKSMFEKRKTFDEGSDDEEAESK